jgi:hypothetical protein
MKYATLVSLAAITVGALSGPLAAAPAMIDIGTAFERAMAGQDGIVTVGDDDRREERREDHDERDKSDDNDDRGNDGVDDSGSGRDEPRIPGGSGYDDPEDILEHAECTPEV